MAQKFFPSINRTTELDSELLAKHTNTLVSRFGDETFICTEKVHGANFSIHYKDGEIKCAKRTDFITEADNFFNNVWVKLVNQLKYDLECLHNEIGDFVLFGELAGGNANGITDKESCMIQKEIGYAPFNFLYFFQLEVNGKMLPKWQFLYLMDKIQFPYYSKPIFTGTLKECLDYNTSISSPLAKSFGYDSMMEGVVIEPFNDLVYNGQPILLKKLDPKFDETKENNRKPSKPNATKNDLEKFISLCLSDLRLGKLVGNYGKPVKEYQAMYLNLIMADAIKDMDITDKKAISQLKGGATQAVKDWIASQS